VGRAIKKTFISFGLVSIPIEVHTLQRDATPSLKSLCPSCETPLNKPYWCARCEKFIQHNEITHKGYQVSKDLLVSIEKQKIETLKRSGEGIQIIAFMPIDQISFYLYEKTYVLMPTRDRKGIYVNLRAYWLLLEALKLSGLTALGKFVFRNREHFVLIRNYLDHLYLSILYRPTEIKRPEKIAKLELAKEETELALQLIEQLKIKHIGELQADVLRDSYAEGIRQLIEAKIGMAKEPELPVSKEIQQFKSVMEALKQSVEQAKAKKE